MSKKENRSVEQKMLAQQKELVQDQLEATPIEVEDTQRRRKKKDPNQPKAKKKFSLAFIKKTWGWMKKKRQAIQISIIILLFGLTAFSGILFPRSGLARFIDETIGQFFDLTTLIRNNYLRALEALGILLFFWAFNKIAQMLIDALFAKKAKNITAFLLLKKVIRWAITFAAVFLILTAFGVNSTAIVASVGIIGLVVSFGAQKLVEDVISGLFLIIEKQFAVGDIVIISDYRGIIKDIGLRTTKVMDAANLDVKIINNSDIRNVINLSTNVSTAICEMSIEYSASIPEVEALINPFLPKIKEKYPEILEGPTYVGVQSLGSSDVVLRYTAKVIEADKFKIQRALNRELKIFFDENGIGIPFPQLVIHKGE
jgi:moderate conductance mechanosensitive channel